MTILKLRRFFLISILTLFSLVLSGCWNIKEIQDIYYVAALGIDYKDEKYIAYVQLLDFSNVARLEGARPDKQPPVWIGRGEGITMTEALNQLYKDSQQRLFWGHVSTLILSNTLLEQDIKSSIDFINRYREIRYNVQFYVTNESVEDVLKTKSFFTLSGLSTILHEPNASYKQRSYIQPIQFFQFIRDSNPVGQTAFIPSIKISTENWKEEDKKAPLLRNDGAVFIRNNHLQGWLSESDLNGLRWIDEKTVRSPLWIVEDDQPVVSIVLEKPKVRITPVITNEQVRYNINVSLQAGINEKLKEISENKLVANTKKIIRDEILKTFEKGVEINSDVYRLGEILYRENPQRWNQEIKEKPFFLNKDSIEHINIQVKLVNSGKLKYQESHY